MSYDDPIASADPLPTTRRRLLARFLSSGGSAGAGRDLLQLEKSGAELKIVVATNQARVDSEIASFEEGVNSGQMARDFTLAGGCCRLQCFAAVGGGAGALGRMVQQLAAARQRREGKELNWHALARACVPPRYRHGEPDHAGGALY